MKWLPFLLPLMLFFVEVTHSDDYSTWSHSQAIILNTTETGANVPKDVYCFPLLIRLNPQTFNHFSQTSADGVDIRFAKTNGTHLSYQIERWVDNKGDNDTAEIWVKIDTVYGNRLKQSIMMYWGKVGAVDSSNGPAVFDTANGFAGVWHLNENGNTTAGGYNDATANGNNGTGVSLTKNSDAAGAIGVGCDFDGIADHIAVADHGTLKPSSAITVGCWVKWDAHPAAGEDDILLCKDNGTNRQFIAGWSNNGGVSQWITHLWSSVGIRHDVTSSYESNNYVWHAELYNHVWYYIVQTYDGLNQSLYVNGTVRNCNSWSASLNRASVALTLGGRFTGGAANAFDGKLDEVRMEKKARNAFWIKLCYENQKTDQCLIGYPGNRTGDNYVTESSKAGGTYRQNRQQPGMQSQRQYITRDTVGKKQQRQLRREGRLVVYRVLN